MREGRSAAEGAVSDLMGATARRVTLVGDCAAPALSGVYQCQPQPCGWSFLYRGDSGALLTALIVLFFDVSLSLSCFFGIGRLMQDYAWLKLAILAIGGLVVIRIGAGLLFPGKGGDDGAAQTPQSRTSQSQGFAQRVTSKFGGDSYLLHSIFTAGVVPWCNPQAIIVGTLMLGAFSATLTVGQSTPFITGVETASALWFFGITLLVSLFSHRFSPRIVTAMNRVCGAVVVLYGVKLLADFVMAVL